MNQDPYTILGVSPDADEKTVKKAYKKLAMKHHPDREGGSEAKMKEISEAYTRITKGDTGQNQFSNNGFTWSSNGMSQEDLHDILSGFGNFGDIFGQRSGPHPDIKYRETNRKGRDIAMNLPVTFYQMWHGHEHFLQVNGNTLSVKTPPFVQNGTKIRYTGHGLPPQQMGTPGDLIITILIQRDNKYSIEGGNLVAEHEISVWDAIVGGTTEYQHIDDRVLKISIKEGTPHQSVQRIPGYGLNGNDLFVRLHINIPKNLTDEQKNAIIKWKNNK
jgi:curved DNA-binding protein